MRGVASSKPCPPERPSLSTGTGGHGAWIVLGVDAHKRSHTFAAVVADSGELLGDQIVVVGMRGFEALLRWARGLDWRAGVGA